MAEEFRVSLGVALNESQLGSVRATLTNLTTGTHRVRIDLDTRRVQNQINSIRNQIQNLGRIRIDLGGNNNGGGGGGRNNGFRNTVDDANRAYNELMSLQRRISSASKSIEILDVDANERQIMALSSQLDNLLTRYNALMSAFENDLSYNQLDNLRRSSEITDEKLEELQSRVADLRRNLAEGISTRLFTGDFQNQINGLQDSYNRIGVANQTVVQSIENVRIALAEMNTANASGDIELLIDAQQRYVIALETADNALKDFKRTQNSANRDTKLGQDVELFRQKIQIWSKGNASAAREFADRLDDIQNKLNNCNSTQLDSLKREFKQLQNEAELANTGFKKFFNDIGDQMSHYGVYLSASEMIMYSVQAIKDGINTVKELDTSLVDLQKTAEASASQLKAFYYDANEVAKEYGSTTQEIIQSAADWSRLGFNLQDSKLMAQYSSMLRRISSDLDIESATNGLVSIMKAYGIEAENVLDGVLSKINAVGNTAATSNGEIVQGLQNSAAAMAVMGTTFDETIALFTAGQEISQDAAKVGNALRTISMRIRGYDEETEELSEDLANITGEVIDLTKVASRPEGISLFTDETQTEYKSMYVYLQEISEIFDELGAKQQQELLEKLFGKNRAAIGAAIIQNFQAAEKAMNTMAESAGNAEAEMTIIMDSMEYKLNRLKETGTGIAQNLFQREDMKLVLDVLADLLGLVDKLTESLGLFGTIGSGVVIFNVIKHLKDFTQLRILGDMPSEFKNLSMYVNAATADLKAFMKTPAGVASAIGLVTTAISIGISIYQNAKQQFRDEQQEIYNTAEAALESADAFEESFLAINEFSKKSELTTSEQEQLSSAINTTNGILGDNAIAFDSASGSAQDYLETLQEISKEEIKNQRIEATKKRQAAEELLKDSTWDDFTGSQIGFETYRTKKSSIEILGLELSESITNSWDNNPELISAKNIVEELMSDYIESFTTGSSNTAGEWSIEKFNLQPIDWDVNKDNMDAVADYYYKLIDLTNRLSEEQLTNNDIYSGASSEIANLKTDVEAYTQSKYEELKLLYEEQNGIPTTAGEFIALNNYIMEAAGSYGALREVFQTSLYEDFGAYFNQDLIDKIADIRDKFTSSDKFKNGSLNYQKNESEKFNAWIETLSGREIEILYKVSLDEESANYTFEEWQDAFNNYKIPDEMKLSFSDLMKDDEFKTTVNEYIERVGVLQDALSKIQSGEWDGASDFISLTETFPELTNDANNLENAIVELLGSMNDKQLVAFTSQFGYLETEDDVAALEAFMDSVLKLGQVVGDTSFSINISAETEKMNNLLNAINESVSSTGLSSESIKNIENMFSGLEGYDPSKLFENTEHGIHLNVQALRGLQSQYEAITKVDIQEHLQDLKQEYNSTKSELEGLTEGTVEWYQKSSELSAIENQISEVQQLQAQYEGLTSAYNQWLLAQSTENENDAYLKLSNGIEGIKELFAEGWVGTDDFREAVQLMTDTDLSTASVEDILAVYEKGMPLMEKFFTGGTDGLLNFLNVAKDASEQFNEDWVTLSDDGNWQIDFGIGGDEEIAKAISDMTGLSMSTEQVQILLRALSSAGFDVDLDAAYSSIESLQSRVEGTEEYLKSLGEDPVEIDIYCHDDNIYTEIENAKAKIAEIENSDVDINIKTAQLADAEAKLDVLIKRQIELTQPRFMSVDASSVDSEIQGTLTLLQEYQTAVNNVEALKLKGADASEIEAATSKVQELAGEIAALPDDAKTAVGLELEDNTDDINAVIESIDSQVSNIDATICPTADMTQVTSDIATIEGQEVSVNVITTGEQAIHNLKNAIAEIQDKTVTITANAVGKVNVDNLNTSIKNVQDKTVSATAEVSGKTEVDALKKSIDKLYDKTVKAKASVTGENLVNSLKKAIDNLKSKSVTASASVSGKSLVDALKSSIDALSSKTVYVTSISRSVGGARVDGSAFVQGSAYSNGDWSLKSSGTALGGELGREMIVRNGRYFTIGEHSAEFFNYKKGDIIFNHEQTEQLLSSGKITDGLKRGRAYAQGSTSGKAFSNANGAIHVNGSVTTTPNGDGSGSNSSDSTKEFKETFDWIETAIDRVERAIDSLDKKASSTYKNWSERNVALKSEISEIKDEIALQQAGYNRYIQQANSVGLSADWAAKVRDGKVDIETVTDEGLAEQIKEYQEWYEKALDCRDAVDDLNESLAECYQTAFDNIVAQYDGVLTQINHEKSLLDEYIAQSEAKGIVDTSKFYETLMQSEQANIDKLQQEKEELTASLENAVASGNIEKYSEAWYEMSNQIDEVSLAIEESNTAMLEYANSIREIEWQIFDLMVEKIGQVAKESEFLINLLSNDKLYDDGGQLTDEGMATMGLHSVNYNVYMEQAAKYAEEMQKIEQELANDSSNQDLIDRKEELLELQRQSILAAEDEKQAIVDMVHEGIELELSALQELITTYTDALDARKSLYDYEKKISKQTKEISSLEKQMAAYAGDDSEETKAKVQQLKVSLDEAKENLEEAQYDRYISDQKQLLDDLYLEYETVLNQRLDNIDALMADMVTSVNENASNIANTIVSASEAVGYTMSEEMKNIWKAQQQNSMLDMQQRAEQLQAIVNQLVTNGVLSTQDANTIISALTTGDSGMVNQAANIIAQLIANKEISTEDATNIISALTGEDGISSNTASIITQLAQNGALSTQDTATMITALTTGDSGMVAQATGIVSQLIANKDISTQDAQKLVSSLSGEGGLNDKAVEIITGLANNGTLTTTEVTRLLTALTTGDSGMKQQAADIIAQLIANKDISTADAVNIVSAISGDGGLDDKAAEIIAQLTAEGKLSNTDASTLLSALLTGENGIVKQAEAIIGKLTTDGTLSAEDANTLLNAINNVSAKDVVTTYSQDTSGKLTTIRDTLIGIKTTVDAILKALSSGSVPSSGLTTQSTTTHTPTTSTSSQFSKPILTEKDYYGVALAIVNGGYGWGNGKDRMDRLSEKGFDYDKAQSIVNKIWNEGYVHSGMWKGKYYGITSLNPYHYNQYALGIHNLGRDELAWTQEGRKPEMIIRPSDGAVLTPLEAGDSVVKSFASNNLWDMANNPSAFIRDHLHLGSIDVPSVSETPTTYTQYLDKVVFNLPNVKNYDEMLKALQHDKNFERLITSLTFDKMAGNSRLAKYKSIKQ